MTDQIILIAVDSAEPSLVEKWVAEGNLPTMASLMQKGTWQWLRSDAEISSGSTWVSLLTGTSPAKHGASFTHRQFKSGTYQIRKIYADQFLRDPFWLPLSQAGKRVAIFDFPKSYPLKEINGIQITGWGTESHNCKPGSVPAEKFREINRRFGKHPLADWYHERPKDVKGWIELTQQMIKGAKQRTDITHWLLEKERWDLFAVCFAETHWAGHFFWQLMDEAHPQYDPAIAKDCQELLLKVYQEVDRGIEKIIASRPEATFFILSNTGMGPNYSAVHLVSDILDRLGLGNQKKRTKKENFSFKLLPQKKWGYFAFKKIESIISIRTLSKIRKLFPQRLWNTLGRRFLELGNDWKDCLAFAVPDDFSGAIRINVKGREPNGLVAPGEEYNRLCDTIIQEFRALEIPETGKKAVADVFKVRDRCQGENVDELPDIIVIWQADAFIESLRSPKIGTVSGEFLDERSGAHRAYGFLLACGPTIRSGEVIKEGNTLDIVPTLFHMFGEPISKDWDGKVLGDIFVKRKKEKKRVE